MHEVQAMKLLPLQSIIAANNCTYFKIAPCFVLPSRSQKVNVIAISFIPSYLAHFIFNLCRSILLYYFY